MTLRATTTTPATIAPMAPTERGEVETCMAETETVAVAVDSVVVTVLNVGSTRTVMLCGTVFLSYVSYLVFGEAYVKTPVVKPPESVIHVCSCSS